jgi:hypothetical protein
MMYVFTLFFYIDIQPINWLLPAVPVHGLSAVGFPTEGPIHSSIIIMERNDGEGDTTLRCPSKL